MSGGQPVLAARAVSRRYGRRTALAPTDLEVREGETLALVGPNGAGKSTLLALLAGALVPTSGRVERRADARVGWAPQRPAHYGRLTARENLELFARLEGVADAEGEAERLCAALGLPAGGPPSSELSVGNRQRLNLALALLGDPSVLLLDEPTAPLDPAGRRTLWEAIAGLRERGGTIVFATQNVEELEPLADRVAVLLDSAVVFDGSFDEYERTRAETLFA